MLDQEKLEKLRKVCELPKHVLAENKHFLLPYVNLIWGNGYLHYGINHKRECGEWDFSGLDDAIEKANKLRKEMT